MHSAGETVHGDGTGAPRCHRQRLPSCLTHWVNPPRLTSVSNYATTQWLSSTHRTSNRGF
jgi:hypothetical protein